MKPDIFEGLRQKRTRTNPRLGFVERKRAQIYGEFLTSRKQHVREDAWIRVLYRRNRANSPLRVNELYTVKMTGTN